MAFSFTHSIMPMSELRMDPEKVKKQLKISPVVITNKGKPDFGVCDLETLGIANHIMQIRETLLARRKTPLEKYLDAEDVFSELDKKYSF